MLDEHNESSAKRTTNSMNLVKAGMEKRMPKISMIVKAFCPLRTEAAMRVKIWAPIIVIVTKFAACSDSHRLIEN